jgi:hypothetical protein
LDPDDLIFNATNIVNNMIAKKTARTTRAIEPSDPPVHSSHFPASAGEKFGAHIEHRRFLPVLL